MPSCSRIWFITFDCMAVSSASITGSSSTFEEDGLLYWTMGEPVEETVIINRCKEEESYENRLRAGTLPED